MFSYFDWYWYTAHFATEFIHFNDLRATSRQQHRTTTISPSRSMSVIVHVCPCVCFHSIFRFLHGNRKFTIWNACLISICDLMAFLSFNSVHTTNWHCVQLRRSNFLSSHISANVFSSTIHRNHIKKSLRNFKRFQWVNNSININYSDPLSM